MITMKEIGKLAGVSQPTVSVVLNGKGDEKGIAKKTQEKVLKLAEEYGFRTNAIARSMKTGKTGIIGIIVSKDAMQQTIDYYDNGIANMHFHASLLLAGCRVMLEVVSEEDFNACKMPEILSDGLVDGVIVFSSAGDEAVFTKYLERMKKYTSKVLLLNDISELEISNVAVDEKEVGIKAADCLWECGYRSFGMISCDEYRIALDTRLQSFAERIGELSNNSIQVVSAHAGNRWSLDCGQVAVSELLKLCGNKCPEAIFCANDFFAYGAEIELCNRGFSIPDDVALLGVGESNLAEKAPIPIAAFGVSLSEKTAAVLDIYERWQNGESDYIKKSLAPTLFRRNSIHNKNKE